tara:strand:+ start:828 stop:1355 length:528 start_codon:yes stop_codon:yes gene_type:complete
MIKTLFSIDAFITNIKNWKTKKVKLKKVIKPLVYYRRPLTDFDTTRFGESNKGLTKNLLDIFSEEFNVFGNECGFHKLDITDSWVVKYKQHDHQIIHHHGSTMYSGIIYVDLFKSQESTTFVAPWPNETNGQTKLTKLECKEGDMIIFPGHLMHFVKPNLVKKHRIVISFDINCK